MHIFLTGCTIFGAVHPVCACFLSYLLLLYIGRVHATISGCSFRGNAPCECTKKSLISDTDKSLRNTVTCYVEDGGRVVMDPVPLAACSLSVASCFLIHTVIIWSFVSMYVKSNCSASHVTKMVAIRGGSRERNEISSLLDQIISIMLMFEF